VNRTSVASAGKASVAAGRARWASAVTNADASPVTTESRRKKPVGPRGGNPRIRPFSGVQPSRIAKSSCSMIPSQKLAIASPDTVSTRSAWSTTEFRQSAETTPSGIPTTTEATIATSVSSIVAGSRRVRSSAIARRV
jgi:hypothetical protein